MVSFSAFKGGFFGVCMYVCVCVYGRRRRRRRGRVGYRIFFIIFKRSGEERVLFNAGLARVWAFWGRVCVCVWVFAAKRKVKENATKLN